MGIFRVVDLHSLHTRFIVGRADIEHYEYHR